MTACWSQLETFFLSLQSQLIAMVVGISGIHHHQYMMIVMILTDMLLHFHQFPKNDEVRAIWIQKCRRKDKFNPKTSHICSEHFMPDDYKRDLKGELLNFPTKPILKPTAVPSFNIPSRPEGMTSPSAREKRIKKRQSKKLVTETLAEPPRKILPEVESLPLPEQKTEKDILLERHTTLQKQYEDLKKMFEEQNKTIREHKAQIVKLEKSLEKLLQDFSIETKYREKLENSLKHFFS
nr:PREDICTED: THAP domain-containing protein 1-like [Tribolium castaneum]|eukprot:XP_015840121.1 PREDICTED: THAP domain-containing protein 1-like [Tribolium castaneum]